jgi:Mrp family chromosome partitioning ATPase
LSKYYELLQRASNVEGSVGQSVATARRYSPRTYEMRPVPDAHALSREELVKLVHTLFLLPGKESPKVVVFAGADSASGCSSVCAGAAEALAAHVQDPVCLVDSNLRYPSLHLCLGVENSKGLGEALESTAPIREYLRKPAGDGPWRLSSGLVSSPLRGVMNSSRLAARLGELRQEFRYILMDSAPVNVFSDAISLGQAADGVVLVLSANSTRKEAGRKAKESFEMSGARLLGAVLNNRTYPIPQGIYERL